MKKSNKRAGTDRVRALVVNKLSSEFNLTDIYVRRIVKGDVDSQDVLSAYRKKYAAVVKALNA